MLRLKIIFIACLYLSTLAPAQNVKFERISLEQGLSQSTITGIVQDRYGFLWFGTQEGVNRYDGYGFTIYKYDPYDSTALADNWVTALYEDRAGTLWVGTHAGGLNKLNPGTKTFTHYRHNAKDSTSLSFDFVTAICEDPVPGGALWIGTRGGGLNEFDRATGTFRHYRPSRADSTSLSDNYVTALYIDHSGTLWVGTARGGLNRFDREKKIFIRYLPDLKRPNSLSDNFVTAIGETGGESGGALWIGTLRGGLNRLDRRTDTFKHFCHDSTDCNSISSNSIRSLYITGGEKRNELWIATNGGGLNKFDSQTDTFTHFMNIPNDLHSLSSNYVSVIGEDRAGTLWVGTEGGGLNKFDRKKKRFDHYTNDPNNPDDLRDAFIWALCEDRGAVGRILWAGTGDGGLVKFDRQANVFKHYKHDPANANSLGGNNVAAIYADPDDAGRVLWIGTENGLDKFDTRHERFVHYRHDSNNLQSLSANYVVTIYEDRLGFLWLGTSNGLNKFDRQKGTFTRYVRDPNNPKSLGNNRVLSIGEDRWGALWVGTRNGLDHFDRQTETFTHYRHDPARRNSLSHDMINTIYCDQGGHLWLGTFGGGFNRLVPPPVSADSDTISFTCFTEKDGLANNVVYGILGDEKGHLWLSTNRGLSKFDPATKIFKNYDPADGLQHYEFNASAYHRGPRGEMFFGGINGFNSFFPDSIKDSWHVPPIVLTAFKKFDKTVAFDRELAGLEQISLSHDENFLAFEFVALDYANPQKNRYAYKLEGFDADWVYCGSRRYANYTNLDPGNYIFRVKGSNSDGVWNEAGTSIRIEIAPPFWKTWWFALISLGSLLCTVFVFHEYKVKHKIRRALEMEGVRMQENEFVRKQVADDFHDELGQKLTNMTLFAEILKRNLNSISPENANYLDKIRETSSTLSVGVRNFIWALDPEQDSLYDLAIYLKDSGDEIFDKTGIHFRARGISLALEEIKLPMNWRRHLTLIFKEGMNNILKHAACSNVTLEINAKHGDLIISLSDDGKGFNGNGSNGNGANGKGCNGNGSPNTNGETGRGLYSMSNRAVKLKGEIRVITYLGKGTTIQFKGKMPQVGYGYSPVRRLI